MVPRCPRFKAGLAYSEQGTHSHVSPGFLKKLTAQGHCGWLSKLHVPAGQIKISLTIVAAEKYFIGLDDYGTDDNLDSLSAFRILSVR